MYEDIQFSLRSHLSTIIVQLCQDAYWALTTSPSYYLSLIYHYLSTLSSHAYAHPLFYFAFLFTFRYLRLIVHLVSFWCYKPTPVPANPTLTSKDCTVILPTVDPENPEFIECIESCLINKPAEILIVTVGQEKADLCKTTAAWYANDRPDTKIRVLVSPEANKRKQVALAIPHVKTEILVSLDDHVLWGPKFLVTALAPFEDPRVGAVGTNKRVRKSHTGFNKLSYWNMLGALYLERHNFEIRATNAIDGGVFVISGRTSLHRTKILNQPAFLNGFINERFFFNLCGPLNPDDDNYITRFEVTRGWKIKIQYSDDACIETTLGAYPKFVSQCLRWVRTTWRSNSCSLFTDRTVWTAQPWCVYAVYFTSFFNFAFFNDAALFYLLKTSPYGTTANLWTLGAWIFATKMVKLTAYFRRHPEDLFMLPGYFAFAYFHSLIKLYAGLTFWNCDWSGRNLKDINAAAGAMPSPSTTSFPSQPASPRTPGSAPPRSPRTPTRYPLPASPRTPGSAGLSSPRTPFTPPPAPFPPSPPGPNIVPGLDSPGNTETDMTVWWIQLALTVALSIWFLYSCFHSTQTKPVSPPLQGSELPKDWARDPFSSFTGFANAFAWGT